MNTLTIKLVGVLIFMIFTVLVWEGVRSWFISCPEPPKPDTLIEYRYITKTDTLVVPKFKTIVKKDTIEYRDTIFIHEETNYIAEIDTTYEDSSLTAKVQYVSPIPLDSRSYFNLDFKVREKIVTNTITVEEPHGFFEHRFVPVLGIGLVYTMEGKMDLGGFIGVGLRLN